MSVKLAGGVSNNLAEINSDKELSIALNQDYNKAGHVVIASEINSDGDGVGRVVISSAQER